MKLIVDRMLGKLAKLLRIIGFDTLYSNNIDFEELLCVADKEERIILTRNTLIKKQERAYKFFFIHDNDPIRQLEEVINGLDLKIEYMGVLTRCIGCNKTLVKISKEEADGRVPDYIFKTHIDFSFCKNCNKVYWKGTHYEKMLERLEEFGKHTKD
ncbi:MAG: Mut7-C RNAse domain-containing protein [Thermodesulfobacteriota bacterium]|nr:Mut7-C RNAse domain-containing protein [Thermodesulfobacteriota bacterium]